jgi:hypothetical protein
MASLQLDAEGFSIMPVSLPRNFDSVESPEAFKRQVGELVSRLEDYLNSIPAIYLLQKKGDKRPVLKKGDLVFNFTQQSGVATLQQWNGRKLIPLSLGTISGDLDLIAHGIGAGTDATKFLRSLGNGRWVLADGPVGPMGPAGPEGPEGDVGPQGPQGDVGPIGPAGPAGPEGPEGDVGPIGPEGPEGDVGPAGPAGADGADGAPGSVWWSGSGFPSAGLGIEGDYYLDVSTGDVYSKSPTGWLLEGNIEGPQGDAGPPAPAMLDVPFL